MVARIFLTAVVLLSGYALIVGLVVPRSWKDQQYQWQSNIIRAQRFLYDVDTNANVIVGSSLAARLSMDSIRETTNLSFFGLGVLDGLNLVKQRGTFPQKLFIEGNMLDRPINIAFRESITDPKTYITKKHIPVLRDENQPVGIVGSRVRPVVNYVLRKRKLYANNALENSDHEQFEKLIEHQLQVFSIEPDSLELQTILGQLKELVQHFEAGGTEVIFFEMPVNNRITNLPKAKVLRQKLREYFPQSSYKRILPEDSESYITTDGIHLQVNEAKSYSGHFRRAADL